MTVRRWTIGNIAMRRRRMCDTDWLMTSQWTLAVA
jgi:hypothetical protein